MATITGSPDILIKEEDLTSYTTIDSRTSAGLVGEFEWGPINKIMTIDSPAKLVDTYGYPTDDNYLDWYTARNFLNYSGKLQLVRVKDYSKEVGATAVAPETDPLDPTKYVPCISLGVEMSGSISNLNAKYIGLTGSVYGTDLGNTYGKVYGEFSCVGTISGTSSRTISALVKGTISGDNIIPTELTCEISAEPLNGTKFSKEIQVTSGTTESSYVYVKHFSFPNSSNAMFFAEEMQTTGTKVYSKPHTIVNSGALIENKDSFDALSSFEFTPKVTTTGTGADIIQDVVLKKVNVSETEYISGTAVTGTANIYNHKVEPFVVSRYAGSNGNYISFCILDYDNYDKVMSDSENESPIKALLGTSTLYEDQVAVAVFVANKETGIRTNVEFGIYSKVPNSLDNFGYDNYLYTAFNSYSNYIYLIEQNIDSFTQYGCSFNGTEYYLQGGVTGNTSSDENYNGWEDAIKLFANDETEETQIQILMQGGANIKVGQRLIELAESRKDCVVCLSPQKEEVLNRTAADAVSYLTNSFSSSRQFNKYASSYAFMDGNYKYQYDSYNSCYRWLPLNGDIAGLMCQVDTNERPWMSIGGRTILNCVKLAFYPNKSQRDILYDNNINPVTNFRAEGNVLWGDWTMKTNTAFNFINVRRCFLYMEREIKKIARTIMFKQNDEITNTQFVQSVSPFLSLVQGGRGISEYKIYSGSEVTSTEEMDRGIFRAKIVVKPIRSIRYVELVFTAVRSDIDIEEVIG